MSLTLSYGSVKVVMTYMLQCGYWYIEKILKFSSHTKVFHDSFRLDAELPIYLEGVLCVDVRHLEIVFCCKIVSIEEEIE